MFSDRLCSWLIGCFRSLERIEKRYTVAEATTGINNTLASSHCPSSSAAYQNHGEITLTGVYTLDYHAWKKHP